MRYTNFLAYFCFFLLFISLFNAFILEVGGGIELWKETLFDLYLLCITCMPGDIVIAGNSCVYGVCFCLFGFLFLFCFFTYKIRMTSV